MIRGGKIEDRIGGGGGATAVAVAVAVAPPRDGSDIISSGASDVVVRSTNPEPAPAPTTQRARKPFSFPFAFVGLLLLSLGVFCGLLYASVRMVIVEERGGGGDRDYHLFLPSLLSLQDDDPAKEEEEEVEPPQPPSSAPITTSKLREPRESEKASAATRTKSKPTRVRSRPAVDKKKGAAGRRSEPPPATKTMDASRPPSPYAYAFLLAGCDAKHPESYRPLLSSIYVAIHLLRQYGSTQDAIVYVMMMTTTTSENAAAKTTNSTKPTIATLSADELRVLAELNATVRQIPSVSKPTFHRVMLQKFRVLGLTQYQRVLFLDSDVMPLVNLDLFFELSDPAVTPRPVLKENLIFLDYVSPANGGAFMLSPRPGDLEFVNDMIKEAQLLRNKGMEGKEPWRQFPPDTWDAFDRSGSQYDFHAVSGDQGLLWSWVRHYKRQFSHVVKDGAIKNYVPSDDGEGVRLESVLDDPFAPDRGPVWPVETAVWGTLEDALRYRAAHPRLPGRTKPHDAHMGAFGTLFHFLLAGGGKPWYREGCQDRWDAQRMPAHDTSEHAEKARRFWCQTYHEITVLHNLSIAASDLHSLSKAASYHPSIGSEMWATPGPVTNLLEPDFDPRSYAGSSQ
jgi:hypothetical protein